MKIDDIRENLGQFWGSFSEGWDRLRHTAAGALTRFRPGEQTQLPERHEIDDPRLADEEQRQVHAKRLVGQLLHLLDLGEAGIDLATRGLDDAEAAGIGDRRRELTARDPAHRRLHDWVFDAGMGEHSVHLFPSCVFKACCARVPTRR